MFFKRVSAAILAACMMIGLIGTASAAPVTVIDDWTQVQSVTATSTSPNVSDLDVGPVGGVSALFGDRILKADLTNALPQAGDQVDSLIGGGKWQCNRTLDATGYCTTEYIALTDFFLTSVEFGAINDGAFGGAASVAFYDGNDLLATQVISLGSASYTTFLGGNFQAGDKFRMMLMGDVAIDEALRPITGNLVPEPGGLALAMAGLIGLAWVTPRRRQSGNVRAVDPKLLARSA